MISVSRSAFWWGIALCLLGAVCFSTKAILVKLAYRDTSVEAVPLLALRMLFSLPFFLFTAFVQSSHKANRRFTLRQWLGVILVGCLGYYVSSLLDFVGLQYVSAGMERLILFIYPTLVLILSALLFGRKISPYQWLAVIITYVGLLLALYGETELQQGRHPQFAWGVVLIFACAFTYAGYLIGSGMLIPVLGAAKFNSYAMSFACLAVLIHFAIADPLAYRDFTLPVYVYGLLMAIVSTVIPSYLIAEGIKRIGSGDAAIVGSVGPVSTVLQAYIFLGEPFTLIQGIGTILILIGVLVIGRRPRKPSGSLSDQA